MNEGQRTRPGKNYSFVVWIIVYGAMLVIALLLGSAPVFISYRKILDT